MAVTIGGVVNPSLKGSTMESVVVNWAPVKGHEGSYEVSSSGLVKSVARVVQRKDGTQYRVKQKILAPSVAGSGRGYLKVSLWHQKNLTQKYIHHVVAEAFIGERPDGMQVNHKDGNKHNNDLRNLEYVTPRGNIGHAMETGLFDIRGERHPCQKYSENSIRAAYQLVASGVSRSQASKETGVPKHMVIQVVSGRRWRCLNLDPIK